MAWVIPKEYIYIYIDHVILDTRDKYKTRGAHKSNRQVTKIQTKNKGYEKVILFKRRERVTEICIFI